MSGVDWRALYPFDSQELRLNGLKYHYVDEGVGKPLLMVHGNPTWSFYWRNLVKAFRESHRCVVPDHIGCGLSDKPQKYEYRLAQHIDHLCALVEKLDLQQITLLVHDWGGAIGLGVAGLMPERFARLVIFNSAAFRATRCPWRIRACRMPWLGEVAVRGLNGFAQAATFMATQRRGGLPPAVKAGLLAPYDSWANRIATHRFVVDIPLKPSHPSYQTLRGVEKQLSQLRDLPTALIWGMQDWCFTPYFLYRYLDYFPKAEAHQIDVAGHYIIEDEPQEVTQIVSRFLSSNSLPGELV